MPPSKPKRFGLKDDNVYRQVGRVMNLSLLLPASVFIGYLIGHLLDRLFGTNFLYIVFLGFGTVAGILSLIREVSKTSGIDSSGGTGRGS